MEAGSRANRVVAALFFGCLWCLGAAPALPAFAGEGGELTAGGTLETFGTVYFQGKESKGSAGGNGAEDAHGEVRFRPTLSYAATGALLLFIEGDFRADSEGFASGYIDDPVERSGRRRIANVREAYVDYGRDWLRMRVGRQIFDWSVTDAVSPSDNINPRDWTDIIEFERMAVPAATLRIGYNTYAELVFIPWFSPSILPANGGRWERDLPDGFEWGKRDIPGRDHGQVAVRAGTTLGGFDLGVAYYRGYSYSPSFEPAAVPGAWPAMAATEVSAASISPGFELIPVYRREEVLAVSAAGAAGNFNVRAETGYVAQRGDDDFVQYVVGVDREWSAVVNPVDSLYVLLQYADEAVIRRDSPAGFAIYDFRRILNNAVMAKMVWAFDSEKRWSVKFEGSYNLGDGDSFAEPAVVWRSASGSFELEAGVDILSGRKSAFLGGYGANDRFYSKMTWKF